jgi:hypothetical protein
MHECSETGFFREYSIAAHRLQQKPGFFGIYARVVRNRVFSRILDRSAQIPAKTGFLWYLRARSQKPGFFDKTWLQTAETAKNPVSLVLMRERKGDRTTLM